MPRAAAREGVRVAAKAAGTAVMMAAVRAVAREVSMAAMISWGKGKCAGQYARSRVADALSRFDAF